ncbi:hypothetical protein Sulba_1977 [Sulfurospirillum barnesii SES-3]|uniref:Uncharacterized protein n=1 Tax=Sulfurospirillum barnesii (strain ATCC 700032 / DSM 10660 / SES-3) TaxID=760154 RepID=I3XZ82_SULBS|nr:hypothetical protein Sulba_1977 [Sulfurospirillum barnesii SES-3]
MIPYALESGFALVFMAYLFQLYKTFKTKRGDGIALNGYLVTFITLLGYIFWSKGNIGTVKILELFVHTLTFGYIFSKSKRVRFSKKDTGVFLVALFGSLNLIGGIAQAYKSFQNIAPQDVSFMHYLLIFSANFLFLHVAFLEHDRLAIFVGLIMTNTVYMYILFKTAQGITKRLP